MITGKNYCYGKTHKSRDNYPSGGWCRLKKDCVGDCGKCVKVNGKESEFKRRSSSAGRASHL